ncbi:MAG: hypothetical protein ABIT10_02650 [Alteraurantiacibacter sp.]
MFLSLLALDSYNRRYGQNVGGLSNVGQIGTATILTDSVVSLGFATQDSGFYAIAYQWNGQTVISYRGTNFPKELSLSELYDVIDRDIGKGWSIFTGLGPNSQTPLLPTYH